MRSGWSVRRFAWIAPRVTMAGLMIVLRGSRVAALPQESKLATPHWMARKSGALGAPHGCTRASVPPLLERRARTKDKLGLIRAFQAKITDRGDIRAPTSRVTTLADS